MAAERALLVAAGGGIGDTLLAGVVARALRTRYAAVDAVVLATHADLAAHVPAIDRTIVLGAPLPARYAAAVVTWATLRTALLPWSARIPVRVGQARRLYSPLFTARVVVRSELGDRTTHWTQILLDYARAIGCDTADDRPQFVVRDDEREAARVLLRARGVSGPYHVLHPSRGLSAHRSRWPVEGFVALAARLAARDGLPILVTGSPEDAPIAEAIAAGAGAASSRSPARRRSARSARWPSRRARSSRWIPARCTSRPRSVPRPSGSSRCNRTNRTAGRRGERVAIVRPTYPCPPGHRKETCPDFACVRELDGARILSALDGLLVPTAER
jgi:heptosyltransferase-2